MNESQKNIILLSAVIFSNFINIFKFKNIVFKFESYVISYRTKTYAKVNIALAWFESYVISYRTKT